MMKLVKGHWLQAVLVFLLAIGFFYRINGLDKNYSFWTDEASTARFARGILETGVPQIKSTGFREDSYFVTHYLTAASFFVFGEDEFAARIPEVVFGTLLILAVFYFGKVIFNNQYLGLGAALLTTFSYAQITWSRQARGYVILEVFFLLSLFFLYQIGQANKKRDYFAFFLLTLLSIWTHSLGLILIPIGIVYIVTKRGLAGFIKSKQIFWGTIIFIVVTILFTNLLPAIKVIFINHLPQSILSRAHLFYYHSLFWRQYPLISFLSFAALILICLKEKKEIFWLFVSTLTIYVAGIVFAVSVPFEKYALVVFPLLFLLASYALLEFSKLFFNHEGKQTTVFLLMTLFILINGNKFSLVPRTFFSMNFDMREIPEIDYKGIYDLAGVKIGREGLQKIAIVDLSSDMPAWYLGEGKNLFIPRNDVVKGITRNTNSGGIYIHNLDELLNIYKDYPQGLVVLVEHNFRFYPQGLVAFVRENLKLEKREEVAWFSPDWNSWPIELYSWGLN